MKILVTGADGYIGKSTSSALSLNHAVSVSDIIYHMDYRDITPKILEEFDAIIHLAAHSSVRACQDDPIGAFDNNLSGVIGLVGKLRPDQKFIYASSGSLYSDGIGGSAASFRNMYDMTKYAADAAVRLLRPKNSYGLRFGTVCGASPNMRWDLMLNGMVRDAKEKRVVTVVSPHTRRPVLAMSDLCRAVSQIMTDNAIEPGIHNLMSFSGTVSSYAVAVAMNMNCDFIAKEGTTSYDFTMEPAPWFKPEATLPGLIREIAGVVPS